MSQQIRKSQVNNSSSKFQYVFSKQQRFPNKKLKYQPPFYDLPGAIDNKKSTSLGYGKKSQLGGGKSASGVPGPGTYLPSIQSNNQSFSFGLGREQVKSNSVFGYNNKVPGPGNYNNIGEGKNKYRFRNLSFSIGGRLPSFQNKWIDKVPGPGNYKQIQTITKDGNYVLSVLKNSCCTKFSKQKRDSFGDIKKNPGPGQYNPGNVINPQCKFIDSKFKYRGNIRFGKGMRKGIIQLKNTPGPGTYKLFSQFG